MAIFIKSFITGFSGAMMPGSLLTYTMEKSMRSGVKAGFLTSLGHALLELVLVILLFLGVGKYLEIPLAQMIIGLLGGTVLIFFGAGMVRDALKGNLSIDMKDPSASNNGAMGTILGSAAVSATNPYFLVWWATAGLGLMMDAHNVLGLTGVVLFYIGHILSDFSWYTFVSFIIGKTRQFINMKTYRIIIAILGAVLIAFGIRFLISSGKTLFGLLGAGGSHQSMPLALGSPAYPF